MENEDKRINVEITNECITVLKNAFKENPSTVSLLTSKMYIQNCKKEFSLNSIFCNMHFQLLLNILKSIESSAKNNNMQVLKNSIPKIYLLLSLLPDFCTEEHWKTDLDNVFLSSLNLCEYNILSIEKVYLSLLGRPSSLLMKYFSKIENLQLANKCTFSTLETSHSPKFILNSRFCQRESLYWSLHHEMHFLHSLMVS